MESCGKQNKNKENFLENRLIWQDSAPEYQYPSENEDIREWAAERHSYATTKKETLNTEMNEKGVKFVSFNPSAERWEPNSEAYIDQVDVVGADGEAIPQQEALKYKMELFLSRDVWDPEGGSISDIIAPGVAYFEKEIKTLIADSPMDGRADVTRDNLNLLVSMYDAVLDAIDWKLASGEKVNIGFLKAFQGEIAQKRRATSLVLAANTDDGLEALKKELGLE